MKASEFSHATVWMIRESRFNFSRRWGWKNTFVFAKGYAAHPTSYQMPGRGFYTRNEGLGHIADHSNNAAG